MPLHRRQIDHQAAIGRRAARDVVPAAPHRDLEPERPRQLDGVGDVGGAAAAGDQRGALVDEPVVHAASLSYARSSGWSSWPPKDGASSLRVAAIVMESSSRKTGISRHRS